MGKKIESIEEMHNMGLPAPGCIYIFEGDNVYKKVNEYLNKFQDSEFYTIRTDTENNSMSCKRLLSATRTEINYLSHDWAAQGFQIILQEFIDERFEIKSGNIYLRNNEIIIEGARMKHHIFTNGKLPEAHIIVDRFDSLKFRNHKLFKNQMCFSHTEILRLIRLARKIPYTKAIVEFSFFENGKLYFWEIKREL